MIKELKYDEWEKIISSRNFSSNADIYYNPSYYDTWKNFENAKPGCLFYQTSKTKFLYPFFKKEINGFFLKKKCYDLFTAYGYGGIIASNNNFSKKDIIELNNSINSWCKNNDIVTEFVRENFIFHQKIQSIRSIEHLQVRTNIYSNLQKNMIDEFSKTSIRNIKKAKRNNLEFYLDKKFEYLNQFIDLYLTTMKKLNASNYFFFNKNYFSSIKKLLKNNAELLCVFDNKQLISSNICFKSNLMYNYHLGSSNPDKLHLRPNDLLFSEMFLRGKELGCHYLNLGGGISNDSNDSLFAFKKKFGTIYKAIYIGKKIYDKTLYEDIEKQWKKKHPSLVTKYKNILQKHHYTASFDYLN